MRGQLSANILALISILVSLLVGLVSVRAAYEINDKGQTPQRSLKAASYGVYSPLEDLKNVTDISIILQSNGETLKDVRVIQSLISNNGRSPIVPSDIYEPISVTVQEPWRIVTVVDGRTQGSGLRLKWVRVDERTFRSAPALMNPGDSALANIYLTSDTVLEPTTQSVKADDIIQWNARISNVKTIEKGEQKNPNYGKFIAIYYSDWGVVFFVFSFVLYFTLYYMLLGRFGVWKTFNFLSLFALASSATISFCATDAGTTYMFDNPFGYIDHRSNAPILIINALILGSLGYISWRRSRNSTSLIP